MTAPRYTTFPHAYLKEFSAKVFQYFKVNEEDAWQAADVLSKADVRGIDSHGVARLKTYVDMF
jgi:L-2-hydroxycarboxylate dehydrogenase (NAD+)